MVYKWKSGSRVHGDAQAVGAELEQIEVLEPKKVVEYARDPSTALHECFEWNDNVAAEKYREGQASYIVRSLVTVEEDAPEEFEYRVYEHVVVDGSRQYVPTRAALQDDELKEQIFQEIGSTIRQARDKAAMYEYLAGEEMRSAQYHLDLALEAVN